MIPSAARIDAAANPAGEISGPGEMTLLAPSIALRIVRRAIGGPVIGMSTFYRWLRNGRIHSIRVGFRTYVPRGALDDFIARCLEGERFRE